MIVRSLCLFPVWVPQADICDDYRSTIIFDSLVRSVVQEQITKLRVDNMSIHNLNDDISGHQFSVHLEINQRFERLTSCLGSNMADFEGWDCEPNARSCYEFKSCYQVGRGESWLQNMKRISLAADDRWPQATCSRPDVSAMEEWQDCLFSF